MIINGTGSESFNTCDKIKPMQPEKTPFHIMVKPRGPSCNLACEYGYYLPKVWLYSHYNFRMSADLPADFTRQVITAQPGDQVNFTWQGGKPTLIGLDFSKEAVRLQKELAMPASSAMAAAPKIRMRRV